MCTTDAGTNSELQNTKRCDSYVYCYSIRGIHPKAECQAWVERLLSMFDQHLHSIFNTVWGNLITVHVNKSQQVMKKSFCYMSIATKSSVEANFVNIQNPTHLLKVLIGSEWLYSKLLCWKLCKGKSDFKCRFNMLKMPLKNFNTE